MGDEYDLLPVFFAGAVFQGLLVSRSMQRAIGVSVLALLSFCAAWWFTLDEPDRLFSMPFFATGIFILGFACFFREQLLPRVSAALVLHYSLLALYALVLGYAPDPVPGWLLGMFAVPMALVAYLGLSPGRPGRFVSLCAYVWTLVVLTWLIGQQFSMGYLKSLYEAEGFSVSLYAYIFVSGMVFLHFAANLLYLLLLIPIGSGRTGFLDRLAGSTVSVEREHRDALVSKVSGEKLSLASGSLLALQAAALFANYRLELVSPGLLMNVAVTLLVLLPVASTEEPEEVL